MGLECKFGCYRYPRVLQVGYVFLAVFLIAANGQFGRFPGYQSRRYNAYRRNPVYATRGQRPHTGTREPARYPAPSSQNQFRASQIQTFNRGASGHAQFQRAPAPSPTAASNSRLQGTNRQAGIQRTNAGIQSRAEVARQQRQHLIRKMRQRSHLGNKIARHTALIRQNSIAEFVPPTASSGNSRQSGSNMNRQQYDIRQPARDIRNQHLVSQRTNNMQVQNNARLSQRTNNMQVQNNARLSQRTNNVQVQNNARLSQRTNNMQVQNNARLSQPRNNMQVQNNARLSQRTNNMQVQHNGRLSQRANNMQVQNNARVSQRAINMQVKNNPRVQTFPHRLTAPRDHNIRNLQNVSITNMRLAPRRLPVVQHRRVPAQTFAASQPKVSVVNTRTKVPIISDRQKSTSPRRNIILLVRRPTKQLPNVQFNPDPKPISRVLMPIPSIVPPSAVHEKVIVSTRTKTDKTLQHVQPIAPITGNIAPITENIAPITGNTQLVNTVANPPPVVNNNLFNPFAPQTLFSGSAFPYNPMAAMMGATNPMAAMWGATGTNGVPVQLQQMGISHPSMLNPGLQQMLFGDTQDPPDTPDPTEIPATTAATNTAMTTKPTTTKPAIDNLRYIVDKMMGMLNVKPNPSQVTDNAGQNVALNDIMGKAGSQLPNMAVMGKTQQSGSKTPDMPVLDTAKTNTGAVSQGATNTVNSGNIIETGNSHSGKSQKDVSSLTHVDIKSTVPDGVASAAIHTPGVKVTRIDKGIPTMEVNSNILWKSTDKIKGVPVTIANSNFGKGASNNNVAVPTTMYPLPPTTVDTLASVNSIAAVFSEMLANVRSLWGPPPTLGTTLPTAPTVVPTAIGGDFEEVEMEDIITTTTPPTTTTTPPATVPTTSSPCNSSSPNFKCQGRHPFSQMAAMGPWCLKMCFLGQCSLSVCECTCGASISDQLATTTQVPNLIPITEPLLAEAAAYQQKSAIKSHINKPKNNGNKKNNMKNTNKINSPKGNTRKQMNTKQNNSNQRNKQRKQKARQRNNKRRPNRRRRPPTTLPTTMVVPTTDEPPEADEIEWEDIVTTTAVPTTYMPLEYTTAYTYDTFTTATGAAGWPLIDLALMALPFMSESQAADTVPSPATKPTNVMWGSAVKAQKLNQDKQLANTTMATPAAVYTTPTMFGSPTTASQIDPSTTQPSRWTDLGIKYTAPQQGWKSRERISRWRDRPGGRASDIPGRPKGRPRESARSRWRDSTPKPPRWQEPTPKPSRWQETTPKPPRWQEPAPEPWREPPTTSERTPAPRRWRDRTPARWREPARGTRDQPWRDKAPLPRGTWRETPVDRWADRGRADMGSGRLADRGSGRLADRGSGRPADRGSGSPADRRWADRRPVDRWRDRGPTTETYWRDPAPPARDRPRDRWNTDPSWRGASRDSWQSGRGRDPLPAHRRRGSWSSGGFSSNRRFGGSLRNQWRENTTPAGEEQEAPEEPDK